LPHNQNNSTCPEAGRIVIQRDLATFGSAEATDPGKQKRTGTVFQPFRSFFSRYPETLASISRMTLCG
ncbi:MAG: hypothetical protein LH624_00485, partial [Cryobacterium sp.]|nr:hypothetical protein [Cryobacterium sp.]